MDKNDRNQVKVGEWTFSTREVLGKGSFAEVYKGRHQKTGLPVAIKIVDIERLTRGNTHNKKLQQHLDSEIEIMKEMNHENIVRLYDVTINKDDQKIYMVLEYCAGGDLSAWIQKNKRLSEDQTRHWLRQLASGLRFLRSKNIIHRDLKPSNLLLSSPDSATAVLKIADFGFAKTMESHSIADTLCGSPMYMAPEILQQGKYSVKADLWSVGCILYEMLTGKSPFNATNPYELYQALAQPIVFPPNIIVSKDCLDLVYALLQRDTTKRISWEEFFLHPFLGFRMLTSAVSIDRNGRSPDATSPPSSVPLATFSPLSSMSHVPDTRVIPKAADARPRSFTVPASTNTAPDWTKVTNMRTGLIRDADSPSSSEKDNTDSSEFERDCVMVHSTDFSDQFVSEEDQLAAELELRINRALTIAELGDSKAEQQHISEALALYIKALQLMQTGLSNAKRQVLTTSLNPTPRLRDLMKAVKEKFAAYFQKSDQLLAVLDPSEPVHSPERLIYQACLQMGKEGAITEMLGNFTKSMQLYSTTLRLLEQLLTESSEKDRHALQQFLVTVSKRSRKARLLAEPVHSTDANVL